VHIHHDLVPLDQGVQVQHLHLWNLRVVVVEVHHQEEVEEVGLGHQEEGEEAGHDH
jgi:hypothetical protein